VTRSLLVTTQRVSAKKWSRLQALRRKPSTLRGRNSLKRKLSWKPLKKTQASADNKSVSVLRLSTLTLHLKHSPYSCFFSLTFISSQLQLSLLTSLLLVKMRTYILNSVQCARSEKRK
jgi:hypothetical protein